MSLRHKLRGTAVDSLLLTFVKVVTTLLGMAVTKLIAVNFSLEEYGTYSQAMLVVNTVTSITILGLTDAVNYFYNYTEDLRRKQDYVSTIFAIQCMVGSASAIITLLLQIPLVGYFDNNQALIPFLWFTAFFPLLHNLLPMLQNLFVSVGRAKTIAVRNTIISVLRLIFTTIACYLTHDLLTVVILSLISQVVQVIYFAISFGKQKFWVNPFKAKWPLIPEILRFCLPMAVYVMSKALLRDIDKYVISAYMDIESLAVYTTASKQLPFDLLTASFITVLIPIITRYLGGRRYQDAQNCFRSYLRLGYLFTWLLAAGAVVVAPQLFTLLYDPKYLPGISVFIIYLFVDMLNFANVSTVMAGAGKTKSLMILSLISVPVNLVLNILSIQWLDLGMIGPALTTLLVNLLTVVLLLHLSAKELQCSAFHLFDWKEMALVVGEILLVGGGCYALRLWLEKLQLPYLVILIITYGIYATCMLALNYKKLITCLKGINRMK